MSKTRHQFHPPQRHTANAYTVILPLTWQQQLCCPSLFALVQPQARLQKSGLALLGLSDKAWQCGWVIDMKRGAMTWQQLHGHPQNMARTTYAALHPITALCDDA